MKLRFFALPLLVAAALTSCTNDSTGLLGEEQALGTEADLVAQAEAFIHDENEDGYTDVAESPWREEIEAHVDGHGFHDINDVEEITVTRPDGTVEELILLDGDIEVTREEYKELQRMVANGEKQYRTNNLVSRNRTYSVIGYTGGGGYGLSSRMRTGLQWAVNNYNRLNQSVRLSLSFSSSTSADLVVYRQPNNSGAGGSAGFPSGGRPYKWVQIYTGMDSYDNNTNEHVMTHEIGHCFGFRHTDYFSRQSCGQNTNEGSSGVGANLIPGTPSGYDPNSIMLSCFGANEDGEFGQYDRVAWNYLY